MRPTEKGRLGPQEHAAAWQRLAGGQVDVLVIGGGVTGAGAALDAATRGLSTALVEARDFASGTSSRSSKLFHGGLRYLEQLNFALVREALRERELMLTRLAPHLVKPVPFLYPLRHRVWERPYLAAGLTLYDTLGGRSSLPRHQHLTRRGALEVDPGLRPDALVGAVRYFDAQVDDARHTMMLARTAAAQGATVRASTEVVGLSQQGQRVDGAVLRDTETGAECHVRAGVVLNCTGVWTDRVKHLAHATGGLEVRASKGVHLLVERSRIELHSGLILRTEKSVLFVIPWQEHWIIGTTDTDWRLDLEHPAASRRDIDYLLGQVNTVLRDPLTAADVVGVYAGLRPLLAGESDETSKLSREHAVERTKPGLVSVAGGKYTTYRVMARDAVDAALRELGGPARACVTETVPVLGAGGYARVIDDLPAMATRSGLPESVLRRLAGRYGDLVTELLAPAAEDPRLLEPVPGADGYLGAEIRYAATHEGARHLDDLLARRTHISVETRHRGTESALPAARLVADVLDWDEAAVNHQVTSYRARVSAELAANQEWNDPASQARRSDAPQTRNLRPPSAPRGAS